MSSPASQALRESSATLRHGLVSLNLGSTKSITAQNELSKTKCKKGHDMTWQRFYVVVSCLKELQSLSISGGCNEQLILQTGFTRMPVLSNISCQSKQVTPHVHCTCWSRSFVMTNLRTPTCTLSCTLSTGPSKLCPPTPLSMSS